MRFVKVSLFIFILLMAGTAFSQDEVIAQAYATVNVRSGPGTQYDIIGQLNSGNEVEITGRNDSESNWLRIEFSGREGWVAYFTVAVLGNAEQLPVVLPRSPQAMAPLRVTSVPTTAPASTDVFVTAYRSVNVRSGPGTEYISIGSLQAGSTADVTGRSNDSEWLRINYGGESGWVAFFVVSLTGLLEAIEVAEVSTGAETETPEITITVVARYNINLREEPTLHSPIIVLIPYGTTLQADLRSDTVQSWLRVTYNGQTGWLIRSLVNPSSNLNNLPIIP